MGSEADDSFEMDPVKVEEENVPLNKENNTVISAKNKNAANGEAATIEIDETNATGAASEPVSTDPSNVPLEEEFYGMIFSILIPFILIGSPFNFCASLDKTYKSGHKFVTSRLMKIYAFCISLIAHSILIFWIVRMVVHMFTLKHLNGDLILQLWQITYIGGGVVALDIIWLNRVSIMDILSNLISFKPLAETAKYQALFTENISTLKRYRLRFTLLLVLSYSLAILLLVYYFFLGFSIISAYTDSDPEGYTHWWSTAIEIVSIYAVFFFAADAILLLSLLWAIQYKVKHLNLYIRNLIKNEQQPDVCAIEIVKSWYMNILATVRVIDRVFAFYFVTFIGMLFFGIIVYISELVDMFLIGQIENAHFMRMFGLITLMAFILFYGLKEFSNVYEESSDTKTIIFDYVLTCKPEDRSTQFFEEVNFVTQGLLSKSACFTLLGQIELNRSFVVHLVLVIYSYAVLFHQFSQKIKK